MFKEMLALFFIGDQFAIQVLGIPAEEYAAEVEDDGADAAWC